MMQKNAGDPPKDHLRFCLPLCCPLAAVSQFWFRIEALFYAHMREHSAGEIRTEAAMIQHLPFTAGFDRTVTAPKGLVHMQAAQTMDGLFSVAALAGYTAA